METDERRLRFLDGARALAVLGVIVYHTVSSAAWSATALAGAPGNGLDWWLTTICAKGAHGVDLFFVLSGFCLSYPYLRRVRETGATTFDAGSYFGKRLVRIVPPFYVAALLWFAIPAIAAAAGHPASGWINPTSWLDFARTLLFLDRKTALSDTSFWTLFVEMRWYVFFPALLALYARNARAFFAVLGACVIAFWMTSLRAIDIGILPGFMLGIVAADWHLTKPAIGKWAGYLTFLAFDLALFIEPYASTPGRSGGGDLVGTYVQTNLGWQLCSFFFVVWAGRFAPLRAVLSMPPLRAVGVATYSIYLVHQPIVGLWAERFAPAASGPASLAGAIVLSILGGALFWAVAERPVCGGPLRAALLAAIRAPLARAFAFAGIPQRFTVTGRVALARERLPERTVEAASPGGFAVTTSS